MKHDRKKPQTSSKKRSLSKRRLKYPFQPRIRKKLLVYVIENKFDVVRRVSKEEGYKITRKMNMISEADLIWNESSAINADILSRMKNFQKINHFPGSPPDVLMSRDVQYFQEKLAGLQFEENVEAVPEAIQLLPDDLLHAHGPDHFRKGHSEK